MDRYFQNQKTGQTIVINDSCSTFDEDEQNLLNDGFLEWFMFRGK